MAMEKVRENQLRQMINLPENLLDSLPGDILNKISDYNRNITNSYHRMVYEEGIKHYKVETHSLSISNRFAEQLYGKMVLFIGNLKAKGIPPNIGGGTSVSFRTVVEDELWTLDIHVPTGNAHKMSHLCSQIITDVRTNEFDEQKYIKLLDF